MIDLNKNRLELKCSGCDGFDYKCNSYEGEHLVETDVCVWYKVYSNDLYKHFSGEGKTTFNIESVIKKLSGGLK